MCVTSLRMLRPPLGNRLHLQEAHLPSTTTRSTSPPPRPRLHWTTTAAAVLLLAVTMVCGGERYAAALNVPVSCATGGLGHSVVTNLTDASLEGSDLLLIVDSDALTGGEWPLRVTLQDCQLADDMQLDVTVAVFLPVSMGQSAHHLSSDGGVEVVLNNSTVASLRVVTIPHLLNRTKIDVDVTDVMQGLNRSLLVTGAGDDSDDARTSSWLAFRHSDDAKRVVDAVLQNISTVNETLLSINLTAPTEPLLLSLNVTVTNGSRITTNGVAVLQHGDWWSTAMCTGGTTMMSNNSISNRGTAVIIVSNTSMFASLPTSTMTSANITVMTFDNGVIGIVVLADGARHTIVPSDMLENQTATMWVQRAVAPSCWPVDSWWDSMMLPDVILAPLSIAVTNASTVALAVTVNSTNPLEGLSPLWRTASAMAAASVWTSYLTSCIGNDSSIITSFNATNECSAAFASEVVVTGRLANNTLQLEQWTAMTTSLDGTSDPAAAQLALAWATTTSAVFISPRLTAGGALSSRASTDATAVAAYMWRPGSVAASGVTCIVSASSSVDVANTLDSSTTTPRGGSSHAVSLFMPPRLTTSSLVANISAAPSVLVSLLIESNSTVAVTVSGFCGTNESSVVAVGIFASPLDGCFGAWAVGLVHAIATVPFPINATAAAWAGLNATTRAGGFMTVLSPPDVSVSVRLESAILVTTTTTASECATATSIAGISVGSDVGHHPDAATTATLAAASDVTWNGGRWWTSSVAAPSDGMQTLATILAGAAQHRQQQQGGGNATVVVDGGSRVVVTYHATTGSTDYATRAVAAFLIHHECVPRRLQQQGLELAHSVANVTSSSSLPLDLCQSPWATVIIAVDNSTSGVSVRINATNTTPTPRSLACAGVLTTVGATALSTTTFADLLLGNASSTSSTSFGASSQEYRIANESVVRVLVVIDASSCPTNASSIVVGGILGLVRSTPMSNNSILNSSVVMWPMTSTVTVTGASAVVAEVFAASTADDCAHDGEGAIRATDSDGIVAGIALPYSPTTAFSSSSVSGGSDKASSLALVVHPQSSSTNTTTIVVDTAMITSTLSSTFASSSANHSNIVAVGVLCAGVTSHAIHLTSSTLNVTVTRNGSATAAPSGGGHAAVVIQNLPLLTHGNDTTQALVTLSVSGGTFLMTDCTDNTTSSNTSDVLMMCSNIRWSLPKTAIAIAPTTTTTTMHNTSFPAVHVTVSIANATLVAQGGGSSSPRVSASNVVVPHVVAALPLVVCAASSMSSSSSSIDVTSSTTATLVAQWDIWNSTLAADTATVAPTSECVSLESSSTSPMQLGTPAYPAHVSISVELYRTSVTVVGQQQQSGLNASGAASFVLYQLDAATCSNNATTTADGTTSVTNVTVAAVTTSSLSVVATCCVLQLGTSADRRALLLRTDALAAYVTERLGNSSASPVLMQRNNNASDAASISSVLSVAHSIVTVYGALQSNSTSSTRRLEGLLATVSPEALGVALATGGSSVPAVMSSRSTSIHQRMRLYATTCNITVPTMMEDGTGSLDSNAALVELIVLGSSADNSSSSPPAATSVSWELDVSLDAVHVHTNMVSVANGSAVVVLDSSSPTNPPVLGASVAMIGMSDSLPLSPGLQDSYSSLPFTRSSSTAVKSTGTVLVTPGSCMHSVTNDTGVLLASCNVLLVPLRVMRLDSTTLAFEAVDGNISSSSRINVLEPESCDTTNVANRNTTLVCASRTIRANLKPILTVDSIGAQDCGAADRVHSLTATAFTHRATQDSHSLSLSLGTTTPVYVSRTAPLIPTPSHLPSTSRTNTSFNTVTAGTCTASRFHTKSSATPTCTIRSATVSQSKHVSRSTRTPSSTAASLTLSASRKVSKSSDTPTVSRGTASPTHSRHVSRSTRTPSLSVSDPNNSTTPSYRATKTNSSSVTPSASPTLGSASVPLSATQSFTPNATPSRSLIRTRSHTASLTRSQGVTRSLASPPTTNSLLVTPTDGSPSVSSTDMSSASGSRQTRTPVASQSMPLTRSKSPIVTATIPLTPTKPLVITATSTHPLPRDGEACQLPAFSVLPGASIDDNAIRAGLLVVWMNLTSPFRWGIDAAQYVTSGPLWTGSQPERSGWLHTVTLNCSLFEDDKYVMMCVVGKTPAYKLLVEETVEFFVSPVAYDGGRCVAPRESPMLVGSVAIATVLSPKIDAARAISALIGVEGFLASWMGAQAMVYDGHLIAMVGQMSCGSNLDNFMTMRLMYLLAPMKDYGNWAVLYFNLALLGTFIVCHVAITFIIQRKQEGTFNDAAEVAAFPGWSYCCAVALHSGICYGTMQIAFHSPPAEAVASVGGFAYIVTIFAVIFYVLRRFAKVAFVEYGFVRVMPSLNRFFLPAGYWDPKQPRRMFGRMLVTVGAGRTMYVPYQMLLLTGFSVITCVRPTTVEGCRTLFLVLAAGIFIAATQVAWWRPHRVPFQNFTTTITMTLLAIQCCLQGPSAADPILNLDNTKAYMWLVQFVVIAIRGLFDTALVLWENFMWGSHREPLFGVLDEDHFAGDDHTRTVDLYYGEDAPEMLKEDALYGSQQRNDVELLPARNGGRLPPPPPPGTTAGISLASPYRAGRSYKDFSVPDGSERNAVEEDFGADADDGVDPNDLAPQHSMSLGRWEGSQGSLSSDEML